MIQFLETLKSRNLPFYYFGWFCLIAALLCTFLIWISKTQVLGINAWIKPFKFFLSSGIFAWTMGWIMVYLGEEKKIFIYSWVVIVVLAFETIYIAYQAAIGQLSHFNIFSIFHSVMFSLMGIAIIIMTVWTGYIGYLFFRKSFPKLPESYVWGLRLGIILFVFFALEGGIMAGRLAHTVGAADGGNGLPITNWSTAHGDLRVAHFMGMHALQILPLVSFYICKNVIATITIAIIYFIVTSLLFIQALLGKPIIGI